MSRLLSDAHPALCDAFLKISSEYMATFDRRSLLITCVSRTQAEQMAEYAKGRTAPGKKVTYKDGLKNLSCHQYVPSHAIDVAVVLHEGKAAGQLTWGVPFYEPLGPLCHAYGLRWGGEWGDYCHLELPGGNA